MAQEGGAPQARRVITLVFNPACSKSREARSLLEASGHAFRVVDYLASPLSEDALRALLRKLRSEPASLVRRKDAEAAGVPIADDASAEDVARLLAARPALMERPVLELVDRAIIARPPSLVAEALAR